jgi:hypothetical protein
MPLWRDPRHPLRAAAGLPRCWTHRPRMSADRAHPASPEGSGPGREALAAGAAGIRHGEGMPWDRGCQRQKKYPGKEDCPRQAARLGNGGHLSALMANSSAVRPMAATVAEIRVRAEC